MCDFNYCLFAWCISGFTCDKKTDLVFVVDSSGSIQDKNPPDNSFDNWELTLQFIANFINQLNIGIDDVRVGLVRSVTKLYIHYSFSFEYSEMLYYYILLFLQIQIFPQGRKYLPS